MLRIAIYGNIMDCMVALIDAVDKLKISTDDHDDNDDVVTDAAAVHSRSHLNLAGFLNPCVLSCLFPTASPPSLSLTNEGPFLR